MTDSLIVRANDTSSHVRLLALDAMTRLQNFRERDCKVIAQYMKSMRSEPVAENRAMAVKRCSLNKETLLDTIDRCLDVDVNVRAEALKKIAGKVKHHVLTSAQVLSLLKHGLEDEDQVRQIVVSNWVSKNWRFVGARRALGRSRLRALGQRLKNLHEAGAAVSSSGWSLLRHLEQRRPRGRCAGA